MPVQHIQPIIGVSMITLFASNAATAVISAGLAWYIRGRGLTGVQIDLTNIKNDINMLKDKLSASTATA